MPKIVTDPEILALFDSAPESTPSTSPKASFVSSVLPYAQASAAKSGLPVELVLAQAALESGWGKSAKGNNYFGIKAHGYGGKTQSVGTHEYEGGKRVNITDSFRAYDSPEQSFDDHADFLRSNRRYKPVFEARDGIEAARALQKAGYATDPKYADKLISIMESPEIKGVKGTAGNKPTGKPTGTPVTDPEILALFDDAPTPNPNRHPAIAYLESLQQAPEAPQGKGFFGDMGDAIWQGFVNTVEGDAYTVGRLTGSETVMAGADALKAHSERVHAGMDEEMRAGAEKKWITEDNKALGEAWGDPDAWKYVIGSGLGSIAATIAGGGLIKIGAKFALKRALTAGVKREVAKGKITQKAAEKQVAERLNKLDPYIGMGAYGAVEGAAIAGNTGRQVVDTVMAMPAETLNTSPYFQEVYWETRDSFEHLSDQEVYDLARKETAMGASSVAMAKAGTVGVLLGTVAGKYLDDALNARMTGGMASRVGTQTGVQGGTESLQAGYEQYAGNEAIQDYANPNQDPWAGVGNAAVGEAIGGGVAGGLLGIPGGGKPEATGAADNPLGDPLTDPIRQIGRAGTVEEALAAANDALLPLEFDRSRPELTASPGAAPEGETQDINLGIPYGGSLEGVGLETPEQAQIRSQTDAQGRRVLGPGLLSTPDRPLGMPQEGLPAMGLYRPTPETSAPLAASQKEREAIAQKATEEEIAWNNQPARNTALGDALHKARVERRDERTLQKTVVGDDQNPPMPKGDLADSSFHYPGKLTRDIARQSGKPFSTEEGARNSAKIRKLTGYTPVQVKGGWVLRRNQDLHLKPNDPGPSTPPAGPGNAPASNPPKGPSTAGFTPTHVTPDGTEVRQILDGKGNPIAGLYEDADGVEIEDNAAEPLSQQDQDQDLDLKTGQQDQKFDLNVPDRSDPLFNQKNLLRQLKNELTHGIHPTGRPNLPKETEKLKADIARLEKEIADAEQAGTDNSQKPERRKDPKTRKKVEEMSAEEMRQALLIDDLTGLGNRRAYQEADKLPVQVSIDADSLKWVNDNLGHESGDKMLEVIGQAIGEYTDQGYHVSGDEFIVQTQTEAQAHEVMEAIARRLEDAIIEVELTDGTILKKQGLGISYGTGATLNEAEHGLQAHKQGREKDGSRAGRGETPPGVSRIPPQGEQDQEGDPAEESVERKPGWQPIGENAEGETVYEDERGVRYVVSNGIRSTETVQVGIKRGGVETSVNPDTRDSRFKVASVQFGNYKEWIEDQNALGLIDDGLAEQIRMDERLEDGEAEILLGMIESKPDKKPDQPKNYGTPENPNVQALAAAYADYFASPDNGFKGIVEARRFAVEKMGGKVQLGAGVLKKIDEAIELGAVLAATEIIEVSRRQNRSDKIIYDRLVDLYSRMPNLSVRTSTSVAQQAYSTPLPIAFLSSRLAGIDENTTVYEPAAGNGALLIEANPKRVIANELNEDRRANLRAQSFAQVFTRDGSEFLPTDDKVDVVITNPPFGVVRDERDVPRDFKPDPSNPQYQTREIDHAIALKALEAMRDDGRAVLILGSVNKKTDHDEKARSDAYHGKAKREFFLTLYGQYNVVDHFTVSGDLYSKQGAGWPIDVIVIEGRGKSSRKVPAADVPPIYRSFDELKAKLDGTRSNSLGAPSQKPGNTAGGQDSAGHQDTDPPGVPGATGLSGAGSAPAGGGPGGGHGGRGGSVRGGKSASQSPQDGQSPGLRDGSDRGQSGVPGAPESAGGDARGDALGGQAESGSGQSGQSDQPAGVGRKGNLPAAGGLAEEINSASDEDIDDIFDDLLGESEADQEDLTDQDPSRDRRIKALESQIKRAEAQGLDTAARDARRKIAAEKQGIDTRQPNWQSSQPEKSGESTRTQRRRSSQADAILATRDQYRKPSVKPKTEGAESTTKTPSENLKDAATEASGAIKEGLNALFIAAGGDSKGTLKSGPFLFNEETYKAALPHFKKAMEHTVAAGKALKDFVAQVLEMAQAMPREFIDQVLRPAVKRFVAEVKSGIIRIKGLNDKSDQKPNQKPNEAQATESQALYTPHSQGNPMATLVPVNQKTAVEDSLDRLAEKVGSLDDYVADRLDYSKDELYQFFGAEQIDALALALNNLENGAGFVIGDQTGIGKGRVVAAMIRYALKKGITPIFVTEKPNLYGDMYRDLSDIGMPGMEQKILMTNAGETVPLNEEGDIFLKNPGAGRHNETLRRLAQKGSLENYEVIFTTYSQMQTLQGEVTDRMNFLQTFARGGFVIFDESHNAGGTEKQEKPDGTEKLDRAVFARQLVENAHSVFYSSATWAKRPQVMDLYAKTDMRLAVKRIKDLGEAISHGGVPLQQVVSSMLARAGQYIRRERSFAGVTYEPKPVPVDVGTYDRFSRAIKQIQVFSEAFVAGATAAMDYDVKTTGASISHDGSTGGAGATSLNFTSIMHNLIDQMLLSIKAKPAVDEALAALERGEKPVITVAFTMGSFIEDYADIVGLSPGDAIGISFNDLLHRYLERSRTITVKRPFQRGPGEKIYLSDEQLGEMGVKAYDAVKKFLTEANFDDLPVSPIDYIKHQLRMKGYQVGEITGRSQIIDYRKDGSMVYNLRSGSEVSIKGRRQTITAFNNGDTHALILNQAGSTGISLHASEKFKDQARRHMIIAQAERNIDTHMQMLGRVHRTGQVVTPAYTQLIADIPAEKRPAAALAKKMASLNANTTANRGGALTAKDVPDFLNAYGDEVVAQIMEDDPDLHKALGSPLSREKDQLKREEAARKISGRIPLLPVKDQEALYALIESEYQAAIEQANATGTNMLEARTLPLDAKMLSKHQVFAGQGGSDSPFADGAYAELSDVKRLGKPYPSDKVLEDVAAEVDAPNDGEQASLASYGRKQILQTLKEAKRDFEVYKAAELAKISDDAENADTKREGVEKRLDGLWNRLEGVLSSVAYPGNTVRLGGVPNTYYGVVIKVKRPANSTKNPAALGGWKVTVYVADAARTLTIPVSKLYAQGNMPSDINDAVRLLSKGAFTVEYAQRATAQHTILEAFDAMQSASRERRVIVTGNLLGGFNAVRNQGSIVNFEDHQGNIRQGVLMPATFNLDTFNREERARLETGAAVSEALAGGPITTRDRDVGLSIQGDNLIVTVPASKKKGGRYFLNRGVLDAARSEFVKMGNTMRLIVPRSRANAVIDALINLDAEFIDPRAANAAANSGVHHSRHSVSRETPRGLSASAVNRIAAAFQKKYPGTLPVKVIVKATQAEAFGPQSRKLGRLKGGWDPDAGHVILIAENLDSIQDAQATLVHELGVHFNLPRLLGADAFNSVLDDLLDARGRNRGVSALFDAVEVDYPDVSERVLAEEVLARAAEKHLDTPFWQKIWGKILQFLRERGLWRGAMSVAEIQALVADSLRSLSRQTDREVGGGQSDDLLASRRIPQEVKDEVVRLYESGLPTKVVAEKTGVSPAYVRMLVLKNGGSMRQTSLADADQERIAELLEGAHRYDGAPFAPEVDPDIKFRRQASGNATWKDALDGAQRAAMSKIGPGRPQTFKEKLVDIKQNLGMKLRQGMVDQYASLLKLDQQLFSKDQIGKNAQLSSWILARMSTSADGALDAALRHGRLKLKGGAIDVDANGKGLIEMLKPLGEEVDRWLAWVAGNRAEKLAAEDRENLFDLDDIRALKSLNQGRTQDGKNRAALYEEIHRAFTEIHDSVVDVAVEAGLINVEERETWRGEFYVPFYRILEDQTEARGPKTLNGLVKQTAYKYLKGGDQQLNDLLGNTLMNWNHLLSASLKNQAAARALSTASKVGVAEIVADGAKSKQAVFVRENGRKVWYEVADPLVLEALTALNWEGFNNPAMKAMRAFKRTFTLAVTASPEFRIANLIRDTVSAAATTPLSTNLLNNVLGDGRKATQKDSLTLARMTAGGGRFSFGHIYGADPEGARRLIKGSRETIIDSPGKLLGSARKLWDRYQEFGDRMENVNRGAIFEQALRRNKDDLLRANFEARDLVDFAQMGAWPAVRFLVQVVPFLNARIQGLDKLARSAMDDKQQRQLTMVTGMVALASMALYLAFKDDEDFKAREQWDRDVYWYFKVGETGYRIPKPFEVGAIGTLAERLLEQLVDDKVHGALFAERLGHMLRETFAFNPTPQMFQPALELWGNRNTFTDRPIESMSMERLSPTERRQVWTSQTAIGASQVMDAISWGKVVLSPVQIEHLVQGYLGWVGATALGVLDMTVSRPLAGAPDVPATRLDEYPILKRFMTESPERHTRYMTAFYDQLKAVEQAYGDISQARRLGQHEKARELTKENREELRLRGMYTDTQRKLNEINNRIKLLQLSRRLSPEEKRERIDRLIEKRNRLTKRVVERQAAVDSR